MTESIFEKAYLISLKGNRKGDLPSETTLLVEKIKKSTIGVVTSNPRKFEIFKRTLSMFGLNKVVPVEIPTDCFDLTDIPALSKALAGRKFRYSTGAELFVARGRLGLPGSGALTVLVSTEGEILSAVTSPPHHLGNYPLETALFVDTFNLLLRLGLKPLHRGITERTLTVYSGKTLFDIYAGISFSKWKVLEPLVETLKPRKVLIIGGYLDGFFFTSWFSRKGVSVFLYDVEGKVYELFETEGLNFKKARNAEGEKFDLVLDLTGFGGIENFGSFKTLVVELPGEDFEKQFPRGTYLLKGNFKGSFGTMSLTVKAVREASREVEERFKIFYCTPNLLNFESLLFNAGSPRSFLFLSKHYPALTASGPKESVPPPALLDEILQSQIGKFHFSLERTD